MKKIVLLSAIFVGVISRYNAKSEFITYRHPLEDDSEYSSDYDFAQEVDNVQEQIEDFSHQSYNNSSESDLNNKTALSIDNTDPKILYDMLKASHNRAISLKKEILDEKYEEQKWQEMMKYIEILKDYNTEYLEAFYEAANEREALADKNKQLEGENTNLKDDNEKLQQQISRLQLVIMTLLHKNNDFQQESAEKNDPIMREQLKPIKRLSFPLLSPTSAQTIKFFQ